jgi:tRNA/tmRNA/rRNA uracil-C5-methylase (TrmA/RlmC/RlmD family)
MKSQNLYDIYVNEQDKWESISKQQLGNNATLVDVSSHSLSSRIYRVGNRIFKIRRIDSDLKQGSKLNKEYQVLLHLENKKNAKLFNPRYVVSNEYEILETDYKSGLQIERFLEMQQASIKQLLKIAWQLLNLNFAGISHRDITSSNIKISETGEIIFLDFDQAIKTDPPRAFLNDFFGIGIGIPKAIHPLRRLAIRILSSKYFYWKKITTLVRQSNNRLVNNTLILKLHPVAKESHDIKTLIAAWELAALSNANTPGTISAYYSLQLAGFGLIGERSWENRWEAIKKQINCHDKKILELGCNMGLFSTFFKLSGAKECIGLDIDKDIIEAAKLVAKAFHVQNNYYAENFDIPGWEEKYKGFDLVIALSVLNWLNRKNEFLSFLSQHKELIYEGHDSFHVEYDRLKSCGFDFIQVISVSERGRIIFYARKNT